MIQIESGDRTKETKSERLEKVKIVFQVMITLCIASVKTIGEKEIEKIDQKLKHGEQ